MSNKIPRHIIEETIPTMLNELRYWWNRILEMGERVAKHGDHRLIYNEYELQEVDNCSKNIRRLISQIDILERTVEECK